MTISDPSASRWLAITVRRVRISRIDRIPDAEPAAAHVRRAAERFSCTWDAPASWQLESARHRDPDFNVEICQYL